MVKKNKKQDNLDHNKHFFLPQDQAMFGYDYVFSASAAWLELGMEDVEASLDLIVRHLPKKRNFLLFAGLEEMVTALLNWHYTKEEVDFLLERKLITPKVAKYFRNFKFTGDIHAMPEGSVFFPGEPVLRISGKMWEVNMFHFILINALTSNTIFSSKMIRGFLAAGDKIFLATCPPIRGHANEACMKFGRIVAWFDSGAGMVPGFAKKFDIPYSSKARGFHAFIKSFPSEIEAMRKLVSIFPDASVMIDTYDLKQGTKNAITVALEQKTKGLPVWSDLFIDSGKDVKEYADRAFYVRKELDKVGLGEIKITVAGNFEEYKIKELVELEAPVDKVIVATEFITPSDDPKLEVVLKMSQYKKDGKIFDAVKLAKGKRSYPGIKQVFRKYKKGKMEGDVIGLENEKLGKALLRPIISKGKLIKKMPSLKQIRKHMESELDTLPNRIKSIDKENIYSVSYSKKLQKLFDKIKKQHMKK